MLCAQFHNQRQFAIPWLFAANLLVLFAVNLVVITILRKPKRTCVDDPAAGSTTMFGFSTTMLSVKSGQLPVAVGIMISDLDQIPCSRWHPERTSHERHHIQESECQIILSIFILGLAVGFVNNLAHQRQTVVIYWCHKKVSSFHLSLLWQCTHGFESDTYDMEWWMLQW